MGVLLAIDPGVHQGWARFVDGVLSSCGPGEPPQNTAPPTDVVIEKPEYRAHDNVRPNDLITLAVRVGRLAERSGVSARLVTPTEWKGPIPKKMHQPRIIAALSTFEKDILDRSAMRPRAKRLDENVVDAVGIGLWALGRLER